MNETINTVLAHLQNAPSQSSNFESVKSSVPPENWQYLPRALEQLRRSGTIKRYMRFDSGALVQVIELA